MLNKKFLIKKVPEITFIFWVTKLATTAMGESASDFLVFRINPYVAVLIGGILLLIGLFIQMFLSNKYSPAIYWFCVAMVAIFGTMLADAIHKQLGISYSVSSIFFGIILGLVFYIWNKSEKTLSIHSITNQKREFFYWATVLSTFALGTALGDLTAVSFSLGYFSSILVFSGLILIPLIGYLKFNMNEVLAFWFAYILTRPVGASIADWLGKPKFDGGVGVGSGTVAVILTIIIVALVCFMYLNKNEKTKELNP